MRQCINLMTERAEFLASTRRLVVLWSLALAGVLLVAAPLGAWAWIERREAIFEHEALQARYEPIRRLAEANRRLEAEAARLVRDERVTLTLARRRPVAALLAAVGEAVAATNGDVFVERVTLSPDAAAKPESVDPAGAVILDVITDEGYDISLLAKSLTSDPFTSVKVVSSEAVAGDVARNKHVIECAY